MSDLREQLARRLRERFDLGAWPESMQETPEGHFARGWESAADEVLRQMEWARRECVESVDSFGAGNSWLNDKTLTLAPEDWKP